MPLHIQLPERGNRHDEDDEVVKNAHAGSEEDNGILIYALVRMDFVHPIFPVPSEGELDMLVAQGIDGD